MAIVKEYISFPWIAVPSNVRINFANKTKANANEVDRELAVFHGKHEDGFIMFESMTYYNWFLLRWS